MAGDVRHARVAGLALLLAALPVAGQPLARLDHVPLVVQDLDAAVTDYRALGFAIKPGRPHANGLRNAHVKFRNGAGIELITAPAARDTLSAHYTVLLAQGEGPAFMTLHAPDEAGAAAALQAAGITHRRDATGIELTDPALGWLFFTGDNRSPTDKPEHFAHTNGACGTREVWVALDDTAPLTRLLTALGAQARDESRPAPLAAVARVFDLGAGGQVVVVPARHQVVPGRPVMGVVLRACGSVANHWPPSRTHGLWLSLSPREP
jgi:catechol 2,3-dioxygenase-like lactoylglutathione lyase family enzyme